MFRVILRREIESLIRRPWSLAILAGPLALLSLLIALRWPGEGQVDLAGERSTQLFRLFALALTGTVLLLAPAYPAAAIVSERRRGTLALLLNTLLSSRSIYLGKLAAALGYTLLPVLMSLPCAAACYALGSIAFARQVLLLYGVLALLALEVATAALAVSCRAASAVSAMRWTYTAILVLTCASLIPSWFALRSDRGDSVPSRWLRSLSPIPAVLEIVGHGDSLGAGARVERGEPLRFAVSAALLSLALAAFATAQINQGMLDRSRAAGAITDDRSRGEQLWRRLAFVIDPQRRSKGTADWNNPVFAKEFRSRRFGRGPWIARMIAVAALASLATTLAVATGAVNWKTEAIGGVLVQLQVALILVVVPSLASGLISDEVEGGGWSLLRMTPLSAWQIAWGKLLSASWTALLLLLATLPGYAVMMLIKPVMTEQVLTVLVTLALMTVLAIALSMAASSVCRRTSHATLLAYGILLALGGTSLGIWAARDAPFGHRIVEAALTPNPVAAALSVIEAPGFEAYHLIPACWYCVGAATLCCLALVLWRTRTLTMPD